MVHQFKINQTLQNQYVKKGSKNIAKKNPYKFKVNALGSIALIGNHSLTISETSKAHI